MASPEAFAQRMGQIAVGIEDNADRVVRTAALVADQTVVLATPVDTGRARANWIASVNRPVLEAREDSYSKSGAESIARASRVIGTYRRGDQSIHLSNNLPYIGFLNAGSSRQAPINFVQRAVLQAVEAVRRAVLIGRSRE